MDTDEKREREIQPRNSTEHTETAAKGRGIYPAGSRFGCIADQRLKPPSRQVRQDFPAKSTKERQVAHEFHEFTRMRNQKLTAKNAESAKKSSPGIDLCVLCVKIQFHCHSLLSGALL